MLVIDRVLGNRHEQQALAADCERAAKDGGLELVELSYQDAQRGRMRVTTGVGTELAVDLGRGIALRDGDVLYRSPDGSRIVVAAVQPAEALVIRLAREGTSQEMFELGIRLGHVLGNQHWPVRVEHGEVLVPVTVDRKVMETVLRTYGMDGLAHEFAPVEAGRLPAAMPPIPHDHD